MSDIKSNLYPDSRLFIQCAVYLFSLAASHHFFLKPLIKLNQERKKRTIGNQELAKKGIQRALDIESSYNAKLAENLERSRMHRLKAIIDGEGESLKITEEAILLATKNINEIKTEIAEKINVEKKRLPELVEDVYQELNTKLGLKGLVLLLVAISSSFFATKAFASEGEFHFTLANTFWPYFQFAIFLFIVVYFGKNIISKILLARRSKMETELKSAKEALAAAEAKVKIYENKLQQSQQEMDSVFTRYEADGLREKQKIIAEAKHLAEQIIVDSRRAANQLVDQNKRALRKELVELAFQTFEKRLTEEKKATLESNFKQDLLNEIKTLTV